MDSVAALPNLSAAGLSELIDPYEAVILDIWGVVHDGLHVFEAAAQCMARLRAKGRPIALVSNSPRPSAGVVAQLAHLGLPNDTYDVVVTSGDATREAIADGRFGRRFLFVGPERDRPLLEGLGLQESELDEAEFVLATGLIDDEAETPDDYAPLLARALARKLPLVCANPDIVVMRGSKNLWCAGALAAGYAEQGGPVHLFGKPHPPIYRLCRERLAARLGHPISPERVLAVGDGIETDVAGAHAAGMDVVLVASGIHQDQLLAGGEMVSPDAVRRLFGAAAARPIAVLPRLRW